MRIALGSDHGGYRLKEAVKRHLVERGFDCEDCGTHDENSCDYPDYAAAACKLVTDGAAERAILVCSTGIGISMAANKTPGIRAAVCSDSYSARYTRLHNDANVLCLGQKVVGEGLACELVDIFLAGEFEGGERHERRVAKLAALDRG